MKVHLKQSKAY